MPGKVLVTVDNYSVYCPEAKKMLVENGFEVIEYILGRPFTFDEIKGEIHDVDAVIAGADTWNEDVFKVAPKLKVISRFGVGVDNIDLDKAREYGIKVTNAKGMNAIAVAELAVGLILGAIRNIPNLNDSTHKGNWVRFMGIDLKGKRVGLLGYGAIARQVAKMLKGFDVELFAFDKYPDREMAFEQGVCLTGMEEILRKCDVVSMHLPSTKETYHIMGNKEFAMMKDGAYFINTARGALIDEKALHDALKSGRLTAAAIDVYGVEPAEASNPLIRLDNIICTSHIASETFDTYAKVSLATAQAIIDVIIYNKTPENLLNG